MSSEHSSPPVSSSGSSEPIDREQTAKWRVMSWGHYEAPVRRMLDRIDELLAEVESLRSAASLGGRDTARLDRWDPDRCGCEEVDAKAVLCRVFDDIDEVYAEWEAFDTSGWFSTARALGAFIRRRLAARAALSEQETR